MSEWGNKKIDTGRAARDLIKRVMRPLSVLACLICSLLFFCTYVTNLENSIICLVNVTIDKKLSYTSYLRYWLQLFQQNETIVILAKIVWWAVAPTLVLKWGNKRKDIGRAARKLIKRVIRPLNCFSFSLFDDFLLPFVSNAFSTNLENGIMRLANDWPWAFCHKLVKEIVLQWFQRIVKIVFKPKLCDGRLH